VYRLSRALSGEAAFDGEGARRVGGRWNLPGTRVVYASTTLSLATLEVMVHLQSYRALGLYWAYGYDLEEDEIAELTDLPPDWAVYPAPVEPQRRGTAWARAGQSLALKVPSAVVPPEYNFLINPLHPAFKPAQVVRLNYVHDQRLLQDQASV
jgi:RES domain-containing protein